MRLFEGIVNKIKDKGNCVICDFDFTEKFPKDYPDEYKFCCSCLMWARFIVEDDEYYSIFPEGSAVSPTVKKILDIITLES